MVPAVVGRLGQDPSPEPDRAAIHVADREDHPLAEPVVDAATGGLPSLGEPDLQQVVAADLALGGQLPGERVPAAGRVAELMLLDDLVGEAPAAKVVQRALTRLRSGQNRVVEGDRALEDVAEARLPGVLPARALVELDAGLRGKDLERLRKRQPVALHDEAEDVSALATTEALPGVAPRGNRE